MDLSVVGITACASPDGDNVCIITVSVTLRSMCKNLLGNLTPLERLLIKLEQLTKPLSHALGDHFDQLVE